MSLRAMMMLAVLAALPALVPARQAAAQSVSSPLAQPPTPLPSGRITIHPRPLLYRRCTDWYELQARPSGTVLYPQMRCWWVRG